MGAIYIIARSHTARWRTARRATTYRLRAHVRVRLPEGVHISHRALRNSSYRERLAPVALRGQLGPRAAAPTSVARERRKCGRLQRLRLRAAAARVAASAAGKR